MTPIRIKCWILGGFITYEEAVWIHEIGARLEITTHEFEDINYYGQTHKMFKSYGSIKIYTQNEDAETLLLLKYSNRLTLSKKEWAIDTGWCALSEINIEAHDAKTW